MMKTHGGAKFIQTQNRGLEIELKKLSTDTSSKSKNNKLDFNQVSQYYFFYSLLVSVCLFFVCLHDLRNMKRTMGETGRQIDDGI